MHYNTSVKNKKDSTYHSGCYELKIDRNSSGLLAACGGSPRSGGGAGCAAAGSEESSRGETCIGTLDHALRSRIRTIVRMTRATGPCLEINETHVRANSALLRIE